LEYYRAGQVTGEVLHVEKEGPIAERAKGREKRDRSVISWN